MSYFNFSHDLFLEVAELNRFSKFIIDDGIKKLLESKTSKFGIIKNPNDLDFENFRTINGSIQKTITIKEGLGIDKNFNFINFEGVTNLSVPNDGNWYWIKIKHIFSTLENGTVNVSSSGVMTGTGTEFTKILRGQPNFPSVIRFQDSANIYEYEINEVISDTQALIAANLIAENNLKFSVVGTFTPGVVVVQDEKYPFRYSKCEVSLIEETVFETKPTSLTDLEFFIARVRVVGDEVEIQDKRVDFWKDNSEFEISYIQGEPNPLFGVENVKFNNELSSKDTNLVEISWGVITDNFSLNTSLNLLTLNSIKTGGIYKSVSDLQSDDLYGWYVYTNGRRFLVKQATKNGSQYDLYLDTLDSESFNLGEEIFICPPYEEIEIFFNPDGFNKNIQSLFFPISIAKAVVELYVFSSNSQYEISYRYKNHKEYSQTFLCNDGVYFNENSFDINGDFKIPQLPEYSSDVISSKITLIESENSFSNVLSKIDLGDIRGVSRTEISNSIAYRELKVGRDLQYQYFGDSPIVTLTSNNFISLSTLNKDGLPIKNGNVFILHFAQKVNNTNVADLYIKQDATILDPLGTGTLLKKFEKYELEQFNKADSNLGLFIHCIFDGTDWILSHEQIEPDSYWKELQSAEFIGHWENITDGSSIIAQPNAIYSLSNSSSLKYRKIGNKFQLKGFFKSKVTIPDFKNSYECFHLPESPPNSMIFPISLVYDGDGKPNQTNLIIFPNGICRVFLGDLAITSDAIFSVDNIEFLLN